MDDTTAAAGELPWMVDDTTATAGELLWMTRC